MDRRRAGATAADTASLRRWGRKGGLRSGEVRWEMPAKCTTVAASISVADRARLQRIMDREGVRLGTVVKRAVAAYLDVEVPHP
jgi:hypothetical protein